jgi:hypothetical protein
MTILDLPCFLSFSLYALLEDRYSIFNIQVWLSFLLNLDRKYKKPKTYFWKWERMTLKISPWGGSKESKCLRWWGTIFPWCSGQHCAIVFTHSHMCLYSLWLSFFPSHTLTMTGLSSLRTENFPFYYNMTYQIFWHLTVFLYLCWAVGFGSVIVASVAWLERNYVFFWIWRLNCKEQ